jgi:6-phospho-beta-glucosidase
MHLEGSGKSAFDEPDFDWNPFEGATGYHRIAVDAISALCSSEPSRLVLNVGNRGAIEDLAPEDVVEVPCLVDKSGARPLPIGSLPETVRGLTISVKTYERLTIQAAIEKRRSLAILALFTNPIVGDWDTAQAFVDKLVESDPDHFDYR